MFYPTILENDVLFYRNPENISLEEYNMNLQEEVKQELMERVLKFVKASGITDEEVYDNPFIMENKYNLVCDLIEIVEPLLEEE